MRLQEEIGEFMLVLTIIILIWAACTTCLSVFVLQSWWIALWVVVGFFTTVLLFCLFILALVPIFKLGSYDSKWKHHIVYSIVSFILIVLRIKMEVVGKENIPQKPFVVFGNHKSMCDVMIGYKAYHTVMSAVSKKSVFKVPLLNQIMSSCGVCSIDRENDREGVKELLKAIKKVEKGFNYLIFPEGGIKTREVETMVDLKPGAYKLATKANATISPMSIIGSSKISSRRFLKKMRIKVIIHKPIYSDFYQDMNTTELGEYVGKIIDGGVINGK